MFLEKLNLRGILRKVIKVTATSPGPFLSSPIAVWMTPQEEGQERIFLALMLVIL